MLNRGALRCAVAGALTLTLMACGGQTNETAATTDAATYKDGTYTATTDVFTGADGRDFGYGVATVTITDGKISACTFETYTPEGDLIDENTFQNVQVTTVVNHENIGELDELFLVMDGLDIDSWRVINLEPIGRALQWPNRMLKQEDYRRLFSFIREKRLAGYPVEYGCSHYLGPELEGELRDWYWLCNAGIYTASIMSNGDVGACLDIERRPETIQGNIRETRFRDIWENRFALFRKDLSAESEYCRGCSHADHCRGDAHHSWDYDKNVPRLCFKGMLFE